MTELLPYEEMFSRLNIGVILFGWDRRVVMVNPAICALTGFPEEKLVGSDFISLLTGDPAKHAEFTRKLDSFYQKDLGLNFDFSFINSNGGEEHVSIRGALIGEGERSGALLEFHRITELKAYEQIIEDSHDSVMRATVDLDAALHKIEEQKQQLQEMNSAIMKEIDMAVKVQKAMVPKRFPSGDRYAVYARTDPASDLNGDFFDFFYLDDRHIGILIADVCGHGVPSALIMTMARAFFEYFTKKFIGAAELMDKVNSEMVTALGRSGFYLTSLVAILDCETLELQSAAAGQGLAYHYCAASQEIREIAANEDGSYYLGCFKYAEYSRHTLQLQAGDRVVFCTDGFAEARNSAGEFFERQGVFDLIQRGAALDGAAFIDDVYQRINSFSEGAEERDDRTMIVLDILS